METQKTCKHPGCEDPFYAKEYCNMHYSRWRQGFDMDAPPRKYNPGHWRPWRVDSAGYVVRYRSAPGRVNKTEKQYQHRYVMEEHIGRALLPDETVHHLNGVRDDNRIQNLELWTGNQPIGQRVSDKIAWAKEILAAYGHEVTRATIDTQTSSFRS